MGSRRCSSPCKFVWHPRACLRCEASAKDHPEIEGGRCPKCSAEWDPWVCERCGRDLVEVTLSSEIGEEWPDLDADTAAVLEEWRELGRDEEGRPLISEQEAMLRRLGLDSAADRSECEIRLGLWRTLTLAQREFTPDPMERPDE